MTTELAAVPVHGARLGWTKRTLEAAGVAVQGVQQGADGFYYLSIAAEDADDAAAALLSVENYVRGNRKRRKPIDLRMLDVLLVTGLVAAGAVALVTPVGAAVMLAALAFARFAFGKMHEPAAEMFALGGKWRMYAVVGTIATLLVVAVFIAMAGGMAVAEIADGNSALKLLEVTP